MYHILVNLCPSNPTFWLAVESRKKLVQGSNSFAVLEETNAKIKLPSSIIWPGTTNSKIMKCQIMEFQGQIQKFALPSFA